MQRPVAIFVPFLSLLSQLIARCPGQYFGGVMDGTIATGMRGEGATALGGYGQRFGYGGAIAPIYGYYGGASPEFRHGYGSGPVFGYGSGWDYWTRMPGVSAIGTNFGYDPRPTANDGTSAAVATGTAEIGRGPPEYPVGLPPWNPFYSSPIAATTVPSIEQRPILNDNKNTNTNTNTNININNNMGKHRTRHLGKKLLDEIAQI